MFTAHAVDYIHNPYFLTKMGLLALAGINMVTFHFTVGRGAVGDRLPPWDETDQTPLGVKISGAVSLGLWISIAACGRWVGFYLDQMRFGS
jgi:hypothetical protein